MRGLSYTLFFNPVLKNGTQLELHFGSGQPPFQISIRLPDRAGAIEKIWNAKDPFVLDLRNCFKTPHWPAKRGFWRHFAPIFNSVALLCSEKLPSIGAKIQVFRRQQRF